MSESSSQAWAVVELFGHQRCAGKISEQTIGGETFVRVDIPQGEGVYTRLFGKGAIYCINICEERTARAYAMRLTPPLQPYAALPAPADAPDPETRSGLSPETLEARPAPRRDRDDEYEDEEF